MRSVVSGVANLQYAALPWRRAQNGLVEILLITTRRTRRWIVPKGWPVPGLLPHQCAALEAFEEAGIEGEAAVRPIGSFPYDKHRKSGETVACTVLLFPLATTRQNSSWPEKGERETRWCSLEEAIGLVGDPGLSRLIRKLGKSLQRPERRRTAAA